MPITDLLLMLSELESEFDALRHAYHALRWWQIWRKRQYERYARWYGQEYYRVETELINAERLYN